MAHTNSNARNDERLRINEVLQSIYGADAKFRKGQYEAIEATLNNKRTLVVQKTGWGKSLVYFVCTRVLRSQGKGFTIIISPLIALIENQIEAARKCGLSASVLNSTIKSKAEKEKVIQDLEEGYTDVLFTTPETLFSTLEQHMQNLNIGMFVIDEAHCVSYWGHDFRLEYTKLIKVVSGLPSHVPLLATTATANDFVIEDLVMQFGGKVFVSRGPLMRKNLYIQQIKLDTRTMKLAWLLENVGKLRGTGIIYCLTTRDCDDVADFLKQNHITAEAYYSGGMDENTSSKVLEKFAKNEIKVIVATVKLGMGYDKGDVSFVIHYSKPENIVSYYQQIGRAGRKIEIAHTIVLHGPLEDDEVLEYFINSSFPKESEAREVLRVLANSSGMKDAEILNEVNIKKSRLEKVLKFLENDDYVYYEAKVYYASPRPYKHNEAHYKKIEEIRRSEHSDMQAYLCTESCFNVFIVRTLSANPKSPCGVCANCTGKNEFAAVVSEDAAGRAQSFVDERKYEIKPRKQWPNRSKLLYVNETGLCCSTYGSPGVGSIVKRDKYASKSYSDELLEMVVKKARQLVDTHSIDSLTNVPSLRSDMVLNFSKRLEHSLGLPFYDLLEKSDAPPQKEMENSQFQCSNARNSFKLKKDVRIPDNILLVDDIVDSGWTFTVCGYVLQESGAKKVVPFALASSAAS